MRSDGLDGLPRDNVSCSPDSAPPVGTPCRTREGVRPRGTRTRPPGIPQVFPGLPGALRPVFGSTQYSHMCATTIKGPHGLSPRGPHVTLRATPNSFPAPPTSAPTPSPGHPPTCPAFLNVILKTLYTQKHSVYTVGCGFSHPGESTRAPSTWHPPVAGSFLLPSCAHDAEEPLCPAVHLLRDARPSRFRLLGIELPCSLTYGVLCDRNCSSVWEKARSIAAALCGNCIFNLTRNCQAPSPGRRHMNVLTGVGCEMRFLPSSVS